MSRRKERLRQRPERASPAGTRNPTFSAMSGTAVSTEGEIPQAALQEFRRPSECGSGSLNGEDGFPRHLEYTHEGGNPMGLPAIPSKQDQGK